MKLITTMDMTAIAAGFFCSGRGEWRRIASFNISAGDDCPSGWSKSSHSGVSFCRSSSDGSGCYLNTFSTNHMAYQRVCGRARGYQKGTPHGFRSSSMNDMYILC